MGQKVPTQQDLGRVELKENKARSTGSDAVFSSFFRSRRFHVLRNVASLVVFVSAAAVWLLSFGRLDLGHEALPWYLIIGTISACSVRFLNFDSYGELQITGLVKTREPLHLRESLALVFMCVAVCMYLMAGYELLHRFDRIPRVMQVVDIQLLSEKDYQDNHSLLPGSKPQDLLRKRNADQLTKQGELNTASASPSKESVANQPVAMPEKEKQKTEQQNKPAKGQKQTKAPTQKPIEKAEKSEQKPGPKVEQLTERKEAVKPLPVVTPLFSAALNSKSIISEASKQATAPVVIPQGWQTKMVSNTAVVPSNPNRTVSSTRSEAFITEVKPLEMVELIENDGETDGIHIFQRGGKSSGGKGAENNLSTYLKELHKKIKKNWAPPRGFTRQVEVIFRLRKDGHLASIKVTKTSGEPLADNSAIKAVMLATSKEARLPSDFSPDCLDVIYTFKYNVDELQELAAPSENEQ